MRIIIIGFGVVGQNFAQLLKTRYHDLLNLYGIRSKIVAVVDRDGAAINSQGLDIDKILTIRKEKGGVFTDWEYCTKATPIEVIEKVNAEIVVETTPTNIVDGQPGLTHIQTALKSGKHVITSNKGPLAIALPSLMQLAQYNHVQLRFSGTVGGGTPILEFAKHCLEGDKIISIRGILNGTTNYILSRMTEGKISFETALSEAQRAGYAETNPSMDIDGLDSAAKLVILANWILGLKITLKDVRIQGIRHITLDQVENALKQNCKVKLIASANGELKVNPELVKREHPICVDGILNAVTFTSQYAGEETLIGRGAGGVETASAILRDLISIKQTISIQNRMEW